MPNAPAIAEIGRLEHRWGQAFVSRDFAFIETIIAPEFKLDRRQPDRGARHYPALEWMRNARVYKHFGFDERTVDVTTAGDTAVGYRRGPVDRADGRRPAGRPIRFVVTDTWVRRHHRWQVIARYSQRLTDALGPPPAK